LPELAFGEAIRTSPGEHYSIYRSQFVLLQAEAFAADSLDLIALDSTAHVFFGNNQTESRFTGCTGAGENQEAGMGGAERGVVKNRGEIAGV